jgi:hypothetical protein
MEDRVTEQLRKVILADGKEYIVKPLSLLEIKRIIPELKKLDELKGKDIIDETFLDQMAKIMYEILKRSDSSLTIEKVFEIVEIDKVYEIIFMAMGRKV